MAADAERGRAGLLDPRGKPILKLHWAMPALRVLADGRWFGPYQDGAFDRFGNWGWVALTASAVWGSVMGLVEVDEDGWWRITDAGRRVLAADRGGGDGA